jgi:hypothetical protein
MYPIMTGKHYPTMGGKNNPAIDKGFECNYPMN